MTTETKVPRTLKYLDTNLKGPLRRIPLGRINVIYGPNGGTGGSGGGKTSIIQSLQLLGGSFAEDIAGRDRVRQAKVLRTLCAGRETDLHVSGMLSSGEKLVYGLNVQKGQAVSTRPDWWPELPGGIGDVFPMESALRGVEGDAKAFQAWMLKLLEPEDLSLSQVAKEFPEDLRPLWNKLSLQVRGTTPLEKLTGVEQKAAAEVRRVRALLKEASPGPRPTRTLPTEGDIERARAAVQERKDELSAAVKALAEAPAPTKSRGSTQELQDELEALEAKLVKAAAWLERAAPVLSREELRLKDAKAQHAQLMADEDQARAIYEAAKAEPVPAPPNPPALDALHHTGMMLEAQIQMVREGKATAASMCLGCGSTTSEAKVRGRRKKLQGLEVRQRDKLQGAQRALEQRQAERVDQLRQVAVKAGELTYQAGAAAMDQATKLNEVQGKINKTEQAQGRFLERKRIIRETLVALGQIDNEEPAYDGPSRDELEQTITDLREQQEQAQEELSRLFTARDEHARFRAGVERNRAKEQDLSRWQDFHAKAKAAQAHLAEHFEATFLMRVAPYVPKDWHPAIEDGKPAWWMEVNAQGHAQHCAPDTPGAFKALAAGGIEYSTAVTALSVVAAQGPVAWVVFPDRGWWPDTLAEVCRGLQAAPKHIQFFIPTTVKPKGRQSKAVNLIDIRELMSPEETG